VVAFAVFLACIAAACGDDGEGTDAVAVGPGAEAEAPVETRRTEPGGEPRWADDVPPVEAPLAAADLRLATLDLGGTSGLVAPLPGRSPSAPTRGSSSSVVGDFSGTVDLELAYYDYCQTRDGNLAFAGSRRYQVDGEVNLNPPAENDGVSERSPFNLIYASEPGVEGSFFVISAQVVHDSRDGREALIDYWDIEQQGDRVTGVLTDRWPGVALNTITTTQLLVPCNRNLGSIALPDTIAEGAQLTGTVTRDRVRLQVVGQSFDREVRFRATIDAERED
jgi:hypothetical protein